MLKQNMISFWIGMGVGRVPPTLADLPAASTQSKGMG
jgi:hypothetical protein